MPMSRAMASSMNTLLLLNEFLPASALSLGCLVDSLRNPAMDAYFPKEPLPQDAVLEVPAKSFASLLASAKSTSFHVAITRLLQTTQGFKDESQAVLTSNQVKRYLLKQPKQVLKALCTEDEEARQWMNEGIRGGKPSYLVVELHTARDLVLSRRERTGRGSDVHATLPVSTIATQGADVLGLGEVLDTGGGIGYFRAHGHEKRFSIDGESIFAVGFKKIIWKSWGFQKQTIEQAVLNDKIKWFILGKKRLHEEADELVSVDLADDLLAKNDIDGDDDHENAEIDDEDFSDEYDVDDWPIGVGEALCKQVEYQAFVSWLCGVRWRRADIPNRLNISIVLRFAKLPLSFPTIQFAVFITILFMIWKCMNSIVFGQGREEVCVIPCLLPSSCGF